MNIPLLNYCFRPIEVLFGGFQGRILDSQDITKRRVFIDNQSDILFVCHLDTVLPPKIHKITKTKIIAQGLDDRLGLYFALTLFHSGIKADLLLTDHEESCKSTAQYHTPKDYKWIVEFDRAGDDFVTYGLASKDLKKELSTLWVEGSGSFTDICFLPTESACFNLGIGYHHSHSKDSYVKISDIYKQIGKFRKFYELHKGITYKQDGTDKEHRDRWNFWKYDVICDACGKNEGKKIYGFVVCKDCLTDFMYGDTGQNLRICAYCGCKDTSTYNQEYGDYLCRDCNDYLLNKF